MTSVDSSSISIRDLSDLDDVEGFGPKYSENLILSHEQIVVLTDLGIRQAQLSLPLTPIVHYQVPTLAAYPSKYIPPKLKNSRLNQKRKSRKSKQRKKRSKKKNKT